MPLFPATHIKRVQNQLVVGTKTQGYSSWTTYTCQLKQPDSHVNNSRLIPYLIFPPNCPFPTILQESIQLSFKAISFYGMHYVNRTFLMFVVNFILSTLFRQSFILMF